VASIAPDDLSGMHGESQCGVSAVNLYWNLKPKLAIMCQCTYVTDRQMDIDIVA